MKTVVSAVVPFVLRIEEGWGENRWYEVQRLSCRLQGYTPLINLGIEVSDALVEAEDIGQLGGEGAGDCAGGIAISSFERGQLRRVCHGFRIARGRRETYDWGRRPLGFQSRSRDSSVKPVSAMVLLMAVELASLARWGGLAVGDEEAIPTDSLRQIVEMVGGRCLPDCL